MTNQEAREFLSRGLETEIQGLRQLDGFKRCAELAVFFSLWAVGLALIRAGFWYHLPLALLGFIAVALALNAFVLLLHEGMHGTLFANKICNDLFSVFLGSTVGISYTAYKVMHLRHHTFLGDHRDPDHYHNYTANKKLIWLLHGLRLACGSLLYLALIPFSAWRVASRGAKKAMLREYTFLALLYSVLFLSLGPTLLWHYHVVSLLLVGFLVNFRGFTQHGLTVPEDPYLASRSIHAHPLVAFLLLNENYHLEHHLFPEVPSYNLKKLHTLIWSRLPRAVKNDSYTEFLFASLKAAPHLDESPIGLVET